MSSLIAAEEAAAAHLQQVLGATVRVHAGAPDSLRSHRIVVASATDVAWSPHRDVVDLQLRCYAKSQTPAGGDDDLKRLLDAVTDGIRSLSGDVYWGGVGTDLAASVDEEVSIDAQAYAAGTVDAVVLADHVIDRDAGTAERHVAAVLAAAGVDVVPSADRGRWVQLRWTGSAPDDPFLDEVRVWCASPAETGTAETWARQVWAILWADQSVEVVEQLAMDIAGQPPGSQAVHETVEIVCRVLTPRSTAPQAAD